MAYLFYNWKFLPFDHLHPFLYFVNIRPLSNMCYANIFSLFILLTLSFTEQKFLILKKSDLSLFFFNFYFWLHQIFVAVRGLSLVVASGGYSLLWCMGFSLRWLLLLWSTGSRCTGFSSCGSHVLELRLSSCGARAQLLRGMLDLPGPGLEPVSSALASGFLTTAPPGKPYHCFLMDHAFDIVSKKSLHKPVVFKWETTHLSRIFGNV